MTGKVTITLPDGTEIAVMIRSFRIAYPVTLKNISERGYVNEHQAFVPAPQPRISLELDLDTTADEPYTITFA